MHNDAIIKKLLEHDRRFDELVTKVDRAVSRDEFLEHMDRMMVILQRLDQERIFTNEAIRRLQDRQDEQQKDIDHLKTVLKVT